MNDGTYLFRVYDKKKDEFTMSVWADSWEDAYFKVLFNLNLDVTVTAEDFQRLIRE